MTNDEQHQKYDFIAQAIAARYRQLLREETERLLREIREEFRFQKDMKEIRERTR